MVAYKRWSHVEVQLYYAIIGQIEQLGALFGSVFPLFLVKLAGGGGVGNNLPLAVVTVLQVTVTSNCF